MKRFVLILCVLAAAALAGTAPPSWAGSYSANGHAPAVHGDTGEQAPQLLGVRSAPQPRKCGLPENGAFDHEPDVLAADASDHATHERRALIQREWQVPLLQRKRTYSPRGPPSLG